MLILIKHIDVFASIIFTTYLIIIGLITLYCFYLFSLFKGARRQTYIPPKKQFSELPHITIQLPIYNEAYVIKKLLSSINKLDYPKEKLEIQILDDSTDHTSTLIKEFIKNTPLAFQFKHLQRASREGYKAGALDYGLGLSKGEFVAIFDADFEPPSDFLIKAIAYFSDPNIALVQCKWGHKNRNDSFLTKAQAMALDVHFSVEHMGRKHNKVFINFNGTAGIWRKQAIRDAGGWSADTLTEDLDLSYRAQIKGWTCAYIETIECPAELPSFFSSLRTQQFRWMKGGAEVVKKMFSNILQHKNLSLKVKRHAAGHLFSSSIFILIFLNAVLSLPLLWIKHQVDYIDNVFPFLSLFLINIILIAVIYHYPFKKHQHKAFYYFIAEFIIFLALSMALSLHNSIAVIEGYLGIKSPFVRTPKYDMQKNWNLSAYTKNSFGLIHILECFMGLYFCFGIVLGLQLGEFGLMPMHLILALGFFTLGLSPIVDIFLYKKHA